MQKRFLVFRSVTHGYLRCTLILLSLFNFYLSMQLGYIWMYAVSVLFLIIVLIVMGFLCSYITVSDRGIKLQYGFWRSYELKWEDILCCGTFSLKILGAVRGEQYIYFSKKPVSYGSLIAGRILPAQSDTFIFIAKQRKALALIQKHLPKFRKLDSLD